MKTGKVAILLLLMLLPVLLLCSCATVYRTSDSEQFSLNQTQMSSSSIGLIMGTVRYGAGFFFPTSSDILDISLLKTDPTTGLVTEISHQRIRNILNFPIQFTVRYDESDISEGDTCTLIVSLLVDDVVKGQGITLLQRNESGFSDADLTLLIV